MEKNKILMIIIIVLLLLVLGTIVGVTFFAYSMYTNNAPEPQATSQIYDLKASDIKSYSINGGKEFATNLANSSNSSNRGVKFSIALGINKMKEVEKETVKLEESLAENEPMIKDTILKVARSYTFEELNVPDGQSVLAAALLERLQELFDTQLIVDIYVDSFVTF